MHATKLLFPSFLFVFRTLQKLQELALLLPLGLQGTPWAHCDAFY